MLPLRLISFSYFYLIPFLPSMTIFVLKCSSFLVHLRQSLRSIQISKFLYGQLLTGGEWGRALQKMSLASLWTAPLEESIVSKSIYTHLKC